MTLTKLAKLANVSVSTASKAFSMSSDINEQTREIVFNTAIEHGCFKKFFNAPYENLVIGMIVPEFNSFVYANIISKVKESLKKYGSEVVVMSSDFSKEKEMELIKYFYMYSSVDGIIIAEPLNDSYSEYETPMVFITNRDIPNSNTVRTSGIYENIVKAMELLKSKGIFEVGYVGEEKSNRRLDMFIQSRKEVFGISDNKFISVTESRFEEGGYSGMKKLFDKNTVPRAVFCSYDYIAIGAIKCIRETGLSVPEDIAVLGFDNISQAEYLFPPLATISVDYDKICETAGDMIFGLITEKSVEKTSVIPSKLYIRKSFDIKGAEKTAQNEKTNNI